MNRYIKAMEIGLAREKEGISYFDIAKQVQSELGFHFDENSELTFLVWFVDNFSSHEFKLPKESISNYRFYLMVKNGYTEKGLIQVSANIENDLNDKYWLDGNASKQYLDYLELQESRLASQQARKQSNFSIAIAILALIVTSGFGLASIKYQPEYAQPPYEVKIIENYPRTNELEKENKQLREELFKAEMMVKVLEEAEK
ncbi:hypothetical protein QSE00_19535 [Arenibacter sp. M-2]|uniref:hypothetical protein n=1 Tax=Arenibacter sp. M-2 TaxID=3053612 RepID=UPI00256FCFE5|nr:hypothetical protein [Arenibacter sp. M-2]MDL5514017.1 hypothetical protein [Arenibacter sp. M-2]